MTNEKFTPQAKLPKDWYNQMSEAKCEYEQWDTLGIVFILPLAWAADYINNTNPSYNPGDYDETEYYDRLTWCGVSVFFGPVDRPVVGGNEWPRMNSQGIENKGEKVRNNMEFDDKDKIELIKRFDLLSEKDKNEMYKIYGKENIEDLKKWAKIMEALNTLDREEAISKMMDVVSAAVDEGLVIDEEKLKELEKITADLKVAARLIENKGKKSES